MPTNNFKLFDENKANMMTDDDYAINQQRLNGVQSGVASSQLQNKTLYQTALMCYALAQLMAANGYDANDANAVSTFVNNLSLSMVQKVVDKASANDVANQVAGKWVDAKQLGELKADIADNYLPLLGGTMLGDLILNRDPTQSLQAATKQYVDGNDIKMQVLIRAGQSYEVSENGVTVTFNFEPKFVIVISYPYDYICRSSQSVAISTPVFLYAQGLEMFGSPDLHTVIEKNGKSLTFKAEGMVGSSGTDGATWELNREDATYYFVAFG